MIVWWLVAAAVFALLFALLGRWLHYHRISRLDAWGAVARGRWVPLAVFFTNAGYWPALSVLGIGSVAAALALRVSLMVPLVILASQVIAQAVVSVLKSVAARSRPAEWLYRHEPGFPYPSGHAVTAIVFYGAWLVVLWNSSLPIALRAAGTLVLGGCALGIGWSRIALGAHYPTDVIGGFLFGMGWLCVLLAAAPWRYPALMIRPALPR